MAKNEIVVDRFFSHKLIFIFSPQPWDHLHISKHHYASTLALNNTVYFISAPVHSWRFSYSIKHVEHGLFQFQYSIPGPSLLRFKFIRFYKAIIKFGLSNMIRKALGKADICFDFGCYKQFDSIDFIPAKMRIFFPVDDFPFLRGEARGCDFVFTVSKNIQRKYRDGRCSFINHGLSNKFAIEAREDLQANKTWSVNGRFRVCYAGNVFLRFIDRETFKKLIAFDRNVEFHFFGDYNYNPSDKNHLDWNSFLRSSPNVYLHGAVSTGELVRRYRDMDAFLLCYKPDNVGYHGENSHKILEYLSTGKVIVSSFIYLYQDTDLFVMPNANSNQELPLLFADVLRNLEQHNSLEKMQQRRKYALAHTYEENIRMISRSIVGSS